MEGRMKYVIIGAGPAGVSVVETVREYDHQVELVVLSAEPYPPYSPPAMADHFITGSQAHLWRGVNWPEQMGVDYRNGTTVMAVDPQAHHLQLADGNQLGYDRLVIATGSRLYAPLDGANLPGIYNFKSLSAAVDLVQQIKSGQANSALIVGAGFIGMEIALLLSDLGVAVTQIEMLDQVMAGMLDKQSAAIVLDMMSQRGVDVRLNTRATAFIGNGRAIGVQLESGQTLRADLIIAATGVKPTLDFLKGSGIQHGWGIQVDDHLRTNVPDIYAAGDVIESPYRLGGEVSVHAIFPNAVEQGRVVGLNLAGYDVIYQGADRMNSLKHLGLPVMAVGRKSGDEVMQTRHQDNLRTLYLKENRLVGFQLVGDISRAGILRALMIQQRNLTGIKNRLLEPTFGQGMIAWSAQVPS
jgi:nitrite reductase (NADH) large subunit